jgi:outer membrane immunogenic protein
MRTESKRFLLIVIGCLLGLLVAPRAGAQAQLDSHFEFGADYNWMHSNAPSGGCGCFSGNGADGWAGWRLTPTLSVVGEGAGQRASNINSTSAGLTMYSFLGGARYTIHSRRRLMPFGKVLAGGAHASGELTPLSSGAAGSATVFAMTAGGGADFAISPGLSVRLVDAEYFYTRFNNGTNDHQNNVRLAAGIVIRLGGR